MIVDAPQRDFYKVLGVSPNAPQIEIDTAYKRLVQRFDLSIASQTPKVHGVLKEKIALLQEAYDTLSNKIKRSEHDQLILHRQKRARTRRESSRPPLNPAGISHDFEIETGNSQNVYEDYFGFSEKPFDITPDPKFLYLSSNHKEVLAHLVYGLQENNGFLKIIGEVGTGKTMICRSFLKDLHTDFKIAYIFNPGIDELELLQTVNSELGLPSHSTSKKKLTDILNKLLLEERARGNRVVLIIDEAQDLLPEVLEQLRLLSNLETETEKLIQIVLIGQPELNELLDNENLRQLRQRITIQWELLPLNREETLGYIQHRINIALGKGKVEFTRPALNSIFRHSNGIPRMINVIADRSLLIAFTLNTRKINRKIVHQAVRDIGGEKSSRPSLSRFFKIIIPAFAYGAMFMFLASDFILPDFKSAPANEKNIQQIAQETPASQPRSDNLIDDPDKVMPSTTQTAFLAEPEILHGKLDSADLKEPASLVISQPDKLVTYLSSLSILESKLEAVKWIIQAWQFEPPKVQSGDYEILNHLEDEYDLLQHETNGNLKKLTTLNYPAILELTLPNAQGTKYLALISVQGNRGIFGSVDKIEMPLEIVNSLWNRKAIILWKDFEYLPQNLKSGFKGKEAVWLQKNLRLLGYFHGLEAPYYGEKTERSVIKFQRKNDIKDDGEFGAESQMLLYNILKVYPTPKLTKS